MSINSKKIILANWKMQLSYDESLNLASKICENIKNTKLDNLEIAILPDFLCISEISQILKNTQVKLGAQNVFWEDKGSFTGEVSPKNLKSFGVEYVIIGHSERRQYLKESNEMICKKIKQAVKNDLIPVLCVGENFEERRNDRKDVVVMEQVSIALKDLEFYNIRQLVIAYEPVWVIGSGQAIDPEEAEHTNLVIKEAAFEAFISNGNNITRDELEDKVKFIYGGSVDNKNIGDFMQKLNIDGVLVGGASLGENSFMDLINIVNKL